MMNNELTRSLVAATTRLMLGMQPIQQMTLGSGWRAVCAALVWVTGSLTIAGCVSVTAPDKPIVIELNINIKQEVIYRLSADAANTIEKNPGIF